MTGVGARGMLVRPWRRQGAARQTTLARLFMAHRIIDLSIYLENDVVSDPPAMKPQITYYNHQDTPDQIAGFFPGLTREDLPDGEGWAVEVVRLALLRVRLCHHGRRTSHHQLFWPA